jgi:hypothetical protein
LPELAGAKVERRSRACEGVNMRVRSWFAGVSAVTVFALMPAPVVEAQTIPDTADAVPPAVVDAATTPEDLFATAPVGDSSGVAPAAVDTATIPDTTVTLPATIPDVPATAAASVEPGSASVTSPGEPVRFSNITDAVPGRFFDAATTAPDPLDPNRLIIGFNSGYDVQTWQLNEFTASTAAFHHRSAVDTISLLVEAPPGSYVSRITYRQNGRGAVARVAGAAGGTNWVVGDVAGDLGLFKEQPTLSGTVDLTGEPRTVVPVSVTTGLFVFGVANAGAAGISVTGAEILVEVLPLLP